ncbi:hypothetical protein Dda_5773 [Drechslerella dactyloides]|uniref:DUF7582 domain-containing protein n=1 Tax=Drechslerella dactyloides TaxID=74499 RepID=A0AAD6NJC5_DREDA|nr:hypothetical protein Dda_5773 [Drechslerella dactyloides]
MSHDTLVEGPSTPATGVSRHSTAEREPPGMEIDTPTLTNALSYVSHRLLQKTREHHTFIVTGDVLFSLFFRSKRTTRAVELLQTSTLSLKQKEALVSGVLKTTEKYGIGRDDWLNNAGEVVMRRLNMHGGDVEEVVARSLVQKEIVFSGDGMTLVAVDFLYELRKMLHLLSRELEGGDGSGSEEMGGVYIDDMVELVRRLVTVEGRGRSLRKEVVEERYKTLVFSDGAWAVLAEEYERRFGEKGLREDGDEVGDRS